MQDHKISLLSAILLNMNILVGSAILFGSGRSAAVAGNASFLSWPFVALLFLPLVLCMAQLSNMFPGQGGFYSYAREGLGIAAGYTSAGLYVVGYTFTAIVEVLVIREMLITALGHHWLLDSVLLFNALCVLICVGINALHFRFVSQFLNTLAITKILPLAILIALVPFILNPHFTITASEIGQIPYGLPFVIFGFWGFEYCCSLTHLIKDGKRNGPRATIIGFLITVALYTMFHFGALNLMGAQNLATFQAPSYAHFLTLPIPFLKSFLMLLIPVASILTIFATANGVLNTNIVMMHALANEKLFWGWSAVTKMSRFDRPWVALVIQGIVIFALASILPLNIAGNLCNLAIASAFLLPFVSLLILQKRKKSGSAIILTLLAIAITFIFSAYSWYQLGTSMTDRLIGTGLFAVILVFGYLLYIFKDSKPGRAKITDAELDQMTPTHN